MVSDFHRPSRQMMSGSTLVQRSAPGLKQVSGNVFQCEANGRADDGGGHAKSCGDVMGHDAMAVVVTIVHGQWQVGW